MARGLPSLAAYQALLGQAIEAALLVISALLLSVGAAAIPAAILGLTANPDLVTGDPAHPALTHGRCEQLLHMLAASSCGQALTGHHLEEVIRNHLLTGWLGFLILVAWWVVHVHRKTQPALLPAGFALTVCSTLLGVRLRWPVATGATILTAALLSWAALAWQATRPARNLTAGP